MKNKFVTAITLSIALTLAPAVAATDVPAAHSVSIVKPKAKGLPWQNKPIGKAVCARVPEGFPPVPCVLR